MSDKRYANVKLSKPLTTTSSPNIHTTKTQPEITWFIPIMQTKKLQLHYLSRIFVTLLNILFLLFKNASKLQLRLI